MARGFWAIKTEGTKICKAILPEEIDELNNNGWDIYATANEVKGFGKREKADLEKIVCFFVDIESGTKEEQIKRIRRGPIPSAITETGRGYHVYFVLKEPIDCTENPVEKADWFRNFQITRLTPFYDGDNNAADATRIMRVPGTRYWKDTDGSFITKKILTTGRTFTVKELETLLPEKVVAPIKDKPSTYRPQVSGGDFWTRCNLFDVEHGLSILSGTSWVNGEVFSIRMEGKRRSIFVNGKTTNAWIDDVARIGSLEYSKDGIPVAGTLFNWLGFYGHDKGTIAKIFKEVLGVRG